MSEIQANKLSPATGTALQVGDSGDTITIPSGATITNNGTQTGFGGTNTPNFHAYSSSNQVFTRNTATLLKFDTEVFDTASAYNNTNGYFTCPRAGHYEVHWHYLHRFNGYIRTTLRKNDTYIYGSGGSTIIYTNNTDSGDEIMASGTAIVNCAVNDTLSIYLYNRSGSADIYGGSNSHNGFTVKFIG